MTAPQVLMRVLVVIAVVLTAGVSAGWDLGGAPPVRFASRSSNLQGTAFNLNGVTTAPIEQRLSVGATGLLRAVRRTIRGAARSAIAAGGAWLDSLTGATLFVLIGLLAPLLDWRLARTWRESGFGAFGASALRALAVYLRLLADGRVPALAKWVIFLAILYGVLPRDVVADTIFPVGLLDDCVAALVASRCFLSLCPNRLVEEHARNVTRGRPGSWRRRVRTRVGSL